MGFIALIILVAPAVVMTGLVAHDVIDSFN